jgi:hypothetical protein
MVVSFGRRLASMTGTPSRCSLFEIRCVCVCARARVRVCVGSRRRHDEAADGTPHDDGGHITAAAATTTDIN